MKWIWGIALLAAGTAGQVLSQPAPVLLPPALPAPTKPVPPPKEGELVEPRKAEEELMPPREGEAVPPGRQDSPVTVDWSGPDIAQVGQVLEYTIRARNTSPVAVHKVQVKLRVPEGVETRATKPKASTDGDVLTWQLDTLLPGQEKSQQVELMVNARKDVSPQAWVSFTGLATVSRRIHVHEPKLALKVAGPERVVAGEPAHLMLTVTNTGECVAGQVKVHADLSEGLEHPRGKSVDFEVGDLAVGESRTVQLLCVARGNGKQQCDVGAGSGGFVKTRQGCVVEVVAPQLEITLSGPTLRYVDRQAQFTLEVANRGEVPAANVTVQEVIPAGFKFLSATSGGRHSPEVNTVTWFVGEVAAGGNRQVEFELMAVKSGEHRHQVRAFREHGFENGVRGELTTRVEDFSALALDLAHADDTLEVGKDTMYEILVSNTGSRVETGISLVCTLPEKMEFKSAQGPTRFQREGNTLTFEPVARLTPRGEVVYQVRVKATSPGDVRFKAQVTSTHLIEPVIKTGATRIYSDRP